MNTAFRKIDIDIYDEDVLQDSELYEADPRGPAEVLEDAKQRQIAVRSFLARYVFSQPASNTLTIGSHLMWLLNGMEFMNLTEKVVLL